MGNAHKRVIINKRFRVAKGLDSHEPALQIWSSFLFVPGLPRLVASAKARNLYGSVAPLVPDVRFFTRGGCGLCQEARAPVEPEMERLLGPARLRFSPCSCRPTSTVLRAEYPDGSLLQVVDIDAQADLKVTLGSQVPVIDIDRRRAFAREFRASKFAAAIRAPSQAVRA